MDVYRVIKTVRHRPIRLNGEVAALEFLPGVKAVYGITQSATQLGFSPGKTARIRLGRTPMGQAVRVYGSSRGVDVRTLHGRIPKGTLKLVD